MVGVITVTLLIVFAMFGFGWAVLLGFIWWVGVPVLIGLQEILL